MEQTDTIDGQKVKRMMEILEEAYPGATTQLIYKNPFQLLIATMLSAQTTDRQVNRVTPKLFNRFPDAGALAEAPLEEIERIINSCGFYKTKAKNIKESCRIIQERYKGEVPAGVKELMALPGVGRKTANVVASNAFGADAIAVDTHVFRVSNRLGLARAADVYKTEQQLMRILPREKWSRAHNWLVHHGRRVCKARKPLCGNCPLTTLCRYYLNLEETDG